VQATPLHRQWKGKGSLPEFVLSLNLHPRHLDESQRAMVAAQIAGMRHAAANHEPPHNIIFGC
jgi:hypothetical protein